MYHHSTMVLGGSIGIYINLYMLQKSNVLRK